MISHVAVKIGTRIRMRTTENVAAQMVRRSDAIRRAITAHTGRWNAAETIRVIRQSV